MMRTFFENTAFVAAEMYRVEYDEDVADRKARRHTLLMYLTQAVQEAEAKPGAVQSVDAETQYQNMFQPGGRWDQITQKGTGAYKLFEKDGDMLIQTDGLLGFVRALDDLGEDPEKDPDFPF